VFAHPDDTRGSLGLRDTSGPLEAGWDHGLSQGDLEYCGEHWS